MFNRAPKQLGLQNVMTVTENLLKQAEQNQAALTEKINASVDTINHMSRELVAFSKTF